MNICFLASSPRQRRGERLRHQISFEKFIVLQNAKEVDGREKSAI